MKQPFRASLPAARIRVALMLLLASACVLSSTAGAARAAATAITTTPDANWDDRFGPFGLDNGASIVHTIATTGTSTYLGGSFSAIGTRTVNNVTLWNGRTFSALGGGVNGQVYALAVSGSNVYVGGNFNSATQSNGTSIAVHGIARWDGSGWHALAQGVDGGRTVKAIAVSGSNVYIGGNFTSASGVTSWGVARWDGTQWNPMAGGVQADSFNDPGAVAALAVIGSNVYAGGGFLLAGTGGSATPASNIAMWDGAGWHALGTGLTNSGAGAQDYALAVNGTQLYVGGNFGAAGGKPQTTGVAMWDGSNWNALAGGGLNTGGVTRGLAVSSGTLYVGGIFSTAGPVGNAGGFAKYQISGAAWGAVNPTPYTGGGNIEAVARNPLGGVFVGGGFPTLYDNIAGNQSLVVDGIASFAGTSWHTLGQGLRFGTTGNTIPALVTKPGGSSVYVGGLLTQAGNQGASVAYWDGSSWHRLGSAGTSKNGPGTGTVDAIAFWGSNVYVGGSFDSIDGVPASNIAVWNGSGWSAIGGGTNGPVEALATNGGYLYVGGRFTGAGPLSLTAPLARWAVSADPADPSGWQGMSDDSPGDLALSGDVTTFAVTSSRYGTGAGPWIVAGGSIEHLSQNASACVNPAGEDIYGLIAWSPTYGYEYAPGCGVASQLPVHALAFQGSNLYVGGEFNTVGAAPSNVINAPGVAKVTWSWPGTWSTLGSTSLSAGARVYGLSVQASNLYVAGKFSTAGGLGANSIARWNGGSWATLGTGLGLSSSFSGATATAVSAGPSGVYTAGSFDLAGGKPAQLFARWGTLPATNLLANPGFESAADGVHPDGWTITPATAAVTRSGAVVHSGSYALQNKSTTGESYSVSQAVSVTARRVYVLNGWASVPYLAGGRLSLKPTIVWTDGTGNTLRTDAAAPAYTGTSPSWDQFVAVEPAPAGAVNATVTFQVANLEDAAYLDDVSFGPA